jgi:hypothetical protein
LKRNHNSCSVVIIMSQIQLLIAHYLKRHYPVVLPAFVNAANVKLDDDPGIDLETLVDEYLAKEAVNQLGKLTIDDYSLSQLMSRDTTATLSNNYRTIEGITTGNLLTVQVREIPRRQFDTTTAS